MFSIPLWRGGVLLEVPTWVLDRVDGDLVVSFTGTQSGHHVLDPPHLALQLCLLLLHETKTIDSLLK